MKEFHKISLLFFILLFGSSLFAQKERKMIRDGNDYYYNAINDTGAVDTLIMQKAELQYRKGLNENVKSYEAGFNLAASLYKQQKFDQAETQYQLLIGKTENKNDQAELYYNIGNSLIGQGKLKESIEAYKNSLRANPKDTAAKYNLAVAQKLLEQQQEDQQNQDQQNQDQQNQEQQNQEQQNQEQQNQDQQNQEQQNQEQQQQQQKQQQQQQQAAQEGKEDQDKDQKQMQATKKDEISKKDAERILMSLSRDEQKLLQKLQKEKSKSNRKKLDKDW